ncbi:MAG: hypothetical protein J3K34DRAFT_396199 [Monoraphidium minutum]|nr:MAG: hypothetical protein J3K34DRAFT_396199 [Monoraphidium minutum]
MSNAAVVFYSQYYALPASSRLQARQITLSLDKGLSCCSLKFVTHSGSRGHRDSCCRPAGASRLVAGAARAACSRRAPDAGPQAPSGHQTQPWGRPQGPGRPRGCVPAMSSEFVAEYRDLLAQLKRNEKRDINCLSMLAEDNKQHAAAVVDAIEQHILVAPAPVKLPALYVLDSIVKNVREPYKSLFAKTLPDVFGSVWDSTLPDKRASLSRLLATWSGVFPADVLSCIKARMAASAAGGGAAAQPLQGVPQPVLLQPGVQMLQVAPGGYGPAPPVVTLQAGTYVPGPQPVAALPPQQHYQGHSGGGDGAAPTGVLSAGGGFAYNRDDPALRVAEMTPAFIKVARWRARLQRRTAVGGAGERALAWPAALRPETHDSIIAALAEASAQTRGAFLDRAFLRKQRERSGGASSRSWYVTVDHWLTGTVAATEAAQAFGGEEEVAPVDEPPAMEPEDPAQPCCAISGEPFDKAGAVYDQEREGWFYRGARRLAGDEAAAHGVGDGAIVKVSALAEAAHAPGGGGGAELDASGLAADIAAAAAGAGAGGGGEAQQQQEQQQQPPPGGAAAVAAADAAVGGGDEEKKAVGVKREAGAEEASPDIKRQRAE